MTHTICSTRKRQPEPISRWCCRRGRIRIASDYGLSLRNLPLKKRMVSLGHTGETSFSPSRTSIIDLTHNPNLLHLQQSFKAQDSCNFMLARTHTSKPGMATISTKRLLLGFCHIRVSENLRGDLPMEHGPAASSNPTWLDRARPERFVHLSRSDLSSLLMNDRGLWRSTSKYKSKDNTTSEWYSLALWRAETTHSIRCHSDFEHLRCKALASTRLPSRWRR